MCLGILSGHDEDQIGTLDRIAAHGGRLHTVGDHDRVEARHLDRRAAELMCEEGEEGLGRMAARPTAGYCAQAGINAFARSEEHTSELQSLMHISYAVLRLKKKK